MRAAAETLGVSRAPDRPAPGPEDAATGLSQGVRPAEPVPRIVALVAARPAHGCRRATAILDRQLRSQGLAPAGHRRTCRIVKAHRPLLARKYPERPKHIQDGKVIAMRSNPRWCSDGSECTWRAFYTAT